MYQNNNNKGKNQKTSVGAKWMNLIPPIWSEIKERIKTPIQQEESGLLNYTENAMEYKFINN